MHRPNRLKNTQPSWLSFGPNARSETRSIFILFLTKRHMRSTRCLSYFAFYARIRTHASYNMLSGWR